MKASAIHEFFQSVGTWMDWATTVDGFRFGDPETEVRGSRWRGSRTFRT